MKNIQKFFAVQLNVGKYNDAEFFAVHHYTYRIALSIAVVAAMTAILAIGIGVIDNSAVLVLKGCAVAVGVFVFTMTHNTKPVQFILKLIAKTLFSWKIDTEVTKSKKQALDELFESFTTNVISEMQSSAQAWREVAEEAKKILHRERRLV